jgi:hypothetical protein
LRTRVNKELSDLRFTSFKVIIKVNIEKNRCTWVAEGGRGIRSKKLSHKNAKKTWKGKKGEPLDFLTAPSTP